MASSKRSVEKEEFWRLVLAEHAASDLSVRAFCKREAVSEASFHFWKREIASRDAKPDSQQKSPQLVPVRVVDSKPTPNRDGEAFAQAAAGQSVTSTELDELLLDRWLESHPQHTWTIDTIRRKERQAKEKNRCQNRRR